jgi:hypothetical protein
MKTLKDITLQLLGEVPLALVHGRLTVLVHLCHHGAVLNLQSLKRFLN